MIPGLSRFLELTDQPPTGISEFWVVGDPVSKKVRWRVIEEGTR